MPYLNSFKQDVWYEFYKGKNPAIVFIHGYAMNSGVWKAQLDFFKDNKRIVLDMRGHGKSHIKPTSKLEDLSEDIKAVLMKERVKKAVLVGHSLGGTVALMFQKMFPEKVDKIVLINPYLNKNQLTVMSALRLLLLNLLFYLPRYDFDHAKKAYFPELRCLLSTKLETLKTAKKLLTNYAFELPKRMLVVNSSRDRIIKPYYNKGICLCGGHILQVDKSKKVNELIKGFLT